jgi:hypothetical protein
LDHYEEGTWIPILSPQDYTSGSESAIYLHRVHIQETDTTAAWVENSP